MRIFFCVCGRSFELGHNIQCFNVVHVSQQSQKWTYIISVYNEVDNVA